MNECQPEDGNTRTAKGVMCEACKKLHPVDYVCKKIKEDKDNK